MFERVKDWWYGLGARYTMMMWNIVGAPLKDLDMSGGMTALGELHTVDDGGPLQGKRVRIINTIGDLDRYRFTDDGFTGDGEPKKRKRTKPKVRRAKAGKTKVARRKKRK